MLGATIFLTQKSAESDWSVLGTIGGCGGPDVPRRPSVWNGCLRFQEPLSNENVIDATRGCGTKMQSVHGTIRK